ncbi:LysR substrate-binding domain-containing protein [Methylopila henanensis]|uniref:LysR substrate-binding domain-containing protein n=1 Tax=Methylopila henanensis TaxID=873516 RepID=A0ABW4K6K8_9HYPH
MRPNLDIDSLRIFAEGFALGSFARAADRLGRSQSAVSAQLKKLEERVGTPLTRKSGRGLALTDAGEVLLGYARRILELNDEAVDRVGRPDLEGWVRLGLSQDFAEAWLPAVLARFARAHPKVRIEVRAERNAELIARVGAGDLDLALAWESGEPDGRAETVGALPLVWIGAPGASRRLWDGEPLPLVAFDLPCIFRSAGVAALDRAGIAWRVAFTSPSLAGLWAAAEARLGVTLRTPLGLPRGLAPLDPARAGLPPLADVRLALHRAEAHPAPAVARLAEILRETIADATARAADAA